MSNNNASDFLSKKREGNFSKPTEIPPEEVSNNVSSFPNPNTILPLNPKKESSMMPTYNYSSMMTPTYENNPLNFFSSSNAIATPLSPAYNLQGGNASYYNYNKTSFTPQQPLVAKTPIHTVGASGKPSEIEYSSTDYQNTPKKDSLLNSHINLPDVTAPKLQNIVSTVNLKCALELRDIALKAKNAEYNPKRFAAVIMRIREPKTTALIFASGKMVCTGARSEEDSRKASRNYAKIIQRLGYQVKFAEFKIQNIVGSCDVRFPIRLEGLASTHSKFCSYEPEMFPGLIYKMAKPKIVLLIFVSGKIVLTGAKERSDIYEAFQNIYPVLQGFRKKETPSIMNEESKQ